ncbi:MAG: DUF2520 domain-containing protein [Tannerella sp.]|jgi:predicted short-subunit dehydrogenase-like oxidoreductase (DUF2520 family)|nr:DUF2520 domain-containing protein [Tannerella sp.]
MKIVSMGAGNVATHLSKALFDAGNEICQIYSRSEESASVLSVKLGCPYTTNVKDVCDDADIYVFAVKDDALATVIKQVKTNNGIWIHTAGSIPDNVFYGFAKNYGVMYPLQTFSKNRKPDFSKVPLFIEGNSQETENTLSSVARTISDNVSVINSEKRKYLHLAAVFACNFTNNMYDIAAQILDEQGIDSRLLLPLIDETADKLHHLTPAKAQTGPAVRNDTKTMDSHLVMLQNNEIRKIYKIISRNIRYFFIQNKQL